MSQVVRSLGSSSMLSESKDLFLKTSNRTRIARRISTLPPTIPCRTMSTGPMRNTRTSSMRTVIVAARSSRRQADAAIEVAALTTKLSDPRRGSQGDHTILCTHSRGEARGRWRRDSCRRLPSAGLMISQAPLPQPEETVPELLDFNNP